MSAGFRAVQWNRAKLVYDSILLASVALYISSYLTLVYWLDPPKDLPAAIDLRIRAFGTCAFFMLTIILSIGPLARLDRLFLPLLYNRRHFGVLTFLRPRTNRPRPTISCGPRSTARSRSSAEAIRDVPGRTLAAQRLRGLDQLRRL